jgi:hypothetical protein
LPVEVDVVPSLQVESAWLGSTNANMSNGAARTPVEYCSFT